MTFRTFNVDAGIPATLLLDSEESGTLVNFDPTITLYVADQDTFAPSDLYSAPIGPGMSVPFDSGPVYGVASMGSIIVAKFPNASAYDNPVNSPAATPPKVKSVSVGSGASLTIIDDPGAGFQIQLQSLAITSVAVAPAGGIANSFSAEDTIIDTVGTQFLACEIGLAAGVATQVTNSVSLPMYQAGPPPHHRLDVVNGGAGGSTALRRCSATAVYYVVGIGL